MLLTTIAKSVRDVGPVCAVLMVFVFVYCLLGMTLFGGKYTDPNVRPRFDSFYLAFLTVFQVLSQENWNDVVRCDGCPGSPCLPAARPLALCYSCRLRCCVLLLSSLLLRATLVYRMRRSCGGLPVLSHLAIDPAIPSAPLQLYDGMNFAGPWACVYFVILMVFGTYIILNLFIAILLNNLEVAEAEEGSPRRVSFVHTVCTDHSTNHHQRCMVIAFPSSSAM